MQEADLPATNAFTGEHGLEIDSSNCKLLQFTADIFYFFFNLALYFTLLYP